MTKPITAELAWRIRQRGLLLATDRQYEDEAIAAAAKRQEELMEEMDRLDLQIQQLAEKS